MYINVTEFKVNFRQDTGSLELRMQTESRKQVQEYLTSFYVIKSELPDFLDSMTGNASYSHTFRDISYFLSVHPSGMHLVELRGDKFTETYVNLPLCKMIEFQEMIRAHINEPIDDTFELSPFEIDKMKQTYLPRVIVDYHDRDEVNLKASIDKWSVSYPDLARYMQSLITIASNDSVYGEDVTIHLYLDNWKQIEGMPDSYYFDIRDSKGNRTLNGGILIHANNDGTFSYSMHT